MKKQEMDGIKYINEKGVAEITGMNVQTLRNYRCYGIGPDYVKAGARSVRYRLDDVINFMEKGRVTHAAKK